MKECFVGIDIGKTNMRVGVAGAQPELKYFAKRAYRRGSPIEMDEQIREAVDEAFDRACVPGSCLAGIGIGVPAIVDRQDGTILFGPDYDFLRGHSITRALQERYRVPIVADVDPVVASWGEQWAGVGRTCDRFALITWGTGIGAGLILDGKVYEGPNNLFAEFGHSVVSDDDWPCNCGATGCIDRLVSGPGIAEHARRAVLAGTETILRDLCGRRADAITCPMVFEAAEQGDPVALRVLERVGVLLGRLASNLVYTIQPEKIVIVGGLTERAHWVLETMNKTMREHCWLIFKGFTRCVIVSSTLGDTAGVLGSIRMVQLKAGAISEEDSRAFGS
jgi:glucokinase